MYTDVTDVPELTLKMGSFILSNGFICPSLQRRQIEGQIYDSANEETEREFNLIALSLSLRISLRATYVLCCWFAVLCVFALSYFFFIR